MRLNKNIQHVEAPLSNHFNFSDIGIQIHIFSIHNLNENYLHVSNSKFITTYPHLLYFKQKLAMCEFDISHVASSINLVLLLLHSLYSHRFQLHTYVLHSF